MNIKLTPEQERFVSERAREKGYDDAGAYIGDLVDRERQAEHAVPYVNVDDPQALEEELRLAATERYDEDRDLAEAWQPLEEEAYDKVG